MGCAHRRPRTGRRWLLVVLLGALLLGGASATVWARGDRPRPLPTTRGPFGVRVPSGACAALVQGRVWVLPCEAPQVRAFRRWRRAAAGLALGVGAALLLPRRARRGAPVRRPSAGRG